MSGLLLRRASLTPDIEVDVLVVDGRVSEGTPPPDADVVDLAGRPVILGLGDHHVHLLALAASWSSVDLSPPALAGAGGLGPALRAARRRQPDGWLRGIGYDIVGSGHLDRSVLDRLGVGPVRVQDRSGGLWILDSLGLDAVLPPDARDHPTGVVCDGAGRPTGILVRLDPWLRRRLDDPPPDLASVGRWMAARGVTSLTDAGAANGPSELAVLAAADLPQRVTAMSAEIDIVAPDGIALGPVKILLDDERLPPLDELAARILSAHQRGRQVAVHCVTEAQAALALAAGVDHRDRIEHASYVPDGLLAALAVRGPTIVAQPGLVASRGDRYLEDHDTGELVALHRLGSFLQAGLRVAVGSDAPYGPSDPWEALATAVTRRTRSGAVLGGAEGVDPLRALDLFSGDARDPGRRRAIAPGTIADLVVLDDGWRALDRRPSVLATLRGGQVIAGALPR